MTFTLTQTFDLLLGSGQSVPDRIGFDDRRWFRRPPPLANGVDENAGDRLESISSSDLDQADDILAMRIKASSRKWAKKAGLDEVPEIDLRRHAPPRLPYDVRRICIHHGTGWDLSSSPAREEVALCSI